jgi:FkbM family methyltransferase
MVDLAPHGRHLAFEALPDMADALRQRFPTVTVRGEAAGRQAGQAEFIHILNAPAYSGLHTQKTYERTDLQFTTITVPTVRIDDCIDDDRVIALMKLDIEGGEFHALQGAERLLLRDHPILVFECCGPTTMDPYGVTIPDMATWLMAHGYKVSSMRKWLSRRGPITIDEMCNGPDYYFMAYP